MFPFHLIISIIIDYQSKSPNRLFSMIDYENPNNRTTLKLAIIHTIAIKWKEKYSAVVVDCHHSLRLYGDRMKKSS